jgi:hypothetical protein
VIKLDIGVIRPKFCPEFLLANDFAGPFQQCKEYARGLFG